MIRRGIVQKHVIFIVNECTGLLELMQLHNYCYAILTLQDLIIASCDVVEGKGRSGRFIGGGA